MLNIYAQGRLVGQLELKPDGKLRILAAKDKKQLVKNMLSEPAIGKAGQPIARQDTVAWYRALPGTYCGSYFRVEEAKDVKASVLVKDKAKTGLPEKESEDDDNEALAKYIGTVDAGGPGSGRHKDWDAVDSMLNRKGFVHTGDTPGGYQIRTNPERGEYKVHPRTLDYGRKVKTYGTSSGSSSGKGFKSIMKDLSYENDVIHAGGPGSGRRPTGHSDFHSTLNNVLLKSNMKGYDINDGYCRDFAVAVAKEHPDVRVHDGITHTYLEHGGKFYDAESPQGVASPEHLSIFEGDKEAVKREGAKAYSGKEYVSKYGKSFKEFSAAVGPHPFVGKKDDKGEGIGQCEECGKPFKHETHWRIVAGGPGSGCKGPDCGRPKGSGKEQINGRRRPILSIKQQRALSNYTPVTKEFQDRADRQEKKLAKALGGVRTNDNSPFDVILETSTGRTHGIEVKSFQFQKNDKVTMTHGALPRKVGWLQKNKAFGHTVVIDMRQSKTNPTYYHRAAVGSFRLTTMKPYDNINALKNAIISGRN